MQYHDAQKTALSSELQVILYTNTGGGGSSASAFVKPAADNTPVIL